MNGILRFSLICLMAITCGLSQAQIFTETFSKCAGKGGNDNAFSAITGNAELSDELTDNAGWTGDKAYAASGCVSVGTSNAAGSVTTPALTGLNGNATVSFRAAAWAKDATTLTLAIEGDGSLSAETVEIKKGEFDTYTVNITGGTANTRVTFKGTKSGNRFFLDDVVVTADGGVSKKNANLKFTPDNITIEKDVDEFTAPTFTKETTAEVTFSSDNEAVATVSADGVITLAGGKGTAVITAKAEANDEYYAGEAKCTVAVVSYNTYKKATAITSGKKYLLVAQRDGSTYYAMPLLEDKAYGYLNTSKIEGTVDEVKVNDKYDDAFTFETLGEGYSIKDYLNRYYIQQGTYKSFNTTDAAAAWTVEPQTDGTFKISMNGYYMQFGQGTFTSFGIYTDAQDNTVLPLLYEFQDGASNVNSITVNKQTDANAPIYNLAGQRVSKDTKGILIQNGKKFINK